MKSLILCLSILCLASLVEGQDLASKLQSVSVTIKSGDGEGSGVIITRDVIVDDKGTREPIQFIWTAGHVVDNLRSVRTIVVDGVDKKVVEYKDAQMVQELTERGRKIGEIKLDAKVIRYSDSENGEDLALLMIRKRDFLKEGAVFYESDEPLNLGTELYHVGSLLGQDGANSMTNGIISQIGRVLKLGSGDGVVFDQTTVTAFPGSSGGGVFLKTDHKEGKAGQYIGMLVRGAGNGGSFNFIVPVRRMREWAKKEGIMWAIDTKTEAPPLKDILNPPVKETK